MRRVFAGLCVLLIAVSAPVAAQVTTGTIVGTVTDESGAVLPGVTATVQGANVAGQPTTVTGSDGAYRFPSLPPGEYTVSFTLQGFSTVRREKIPVPLGGTVEINAQLKVSTLQETVTVVGESPVVNVASTQVSTNLNRGRQSDHGDELAIAGFRQQHDRQLVPTRRHRFHRAIHRCGVAVAQYRCDRRSAGDAARSVR